MSQEINHVIIDPVAPGGGTSSPIDTTGANVILFLIVQDFANSFSPSDNQGNSYSASVGRAEPGLNAKFGIFYLLNPTTSASHTFTITGGGLSAGIVIALRTAISADATTTGNGTASGTTVQAGSVTPGGSPAMVVSGMCYSGAVGATDSIDLGFTSYDNPLVGSVHYGCALGYKFQAAAAAINPTWTCSSTADLAAVNMTFVMANDSRVQGHVFG